jgi:hypothetical protein
MRKETTAKRVFNIVRLSGSAKANIGKGGGSAPPAAAPERVGHPASHTARPLHEGARPALSEVVG